MIIVENGILSFSQSPEIEIREGEIASKLSFEILGGTENPSFKAKRISNVYIISIDDIENILSPTELQKQQEKFILTKAFESNHSKLLTSFEFEKLIESMYSRYSLDI